MSKIIKKIDDLGRFSIPREIRRGMRLMGGDEIEVIQKDDTIVLKKYLPHFSSQLTDTKEAFIEWAEANQIKLSNQLLNDFQSLIESIQQIENLE